MYDPNIDYTWVRLNEVAEERRKVDDSERDAIEAARREDWSWERIAEVLKLPSEQAAKRRYQQLTNRLVGIEDDDLPIT